RKRLPGKTEKRSVTGCKGLPETTWLCPARGSAQRPQILFCRDSLPRDGPRGSSLFRGAIKEFQFFFGHCEVVSLAQLQRLRRSQPRYGVLAVHTASAQRAGDNPLRAKVFHILHAKPQRHFRGLSYLRSWPELLRPEADDHAVNLRQVH